MRNRLSLTRFAAFLLTLTAVSFAADPRDYSKEAFVIQNMETKVSFAADGARDWHQFLSVHLQSESAVRQFGVLAFTYSSGDEEMKIEFVRVKKADGSVIETPESSIQDVASQVATLAPTYTDLRQKQIPVKALGVGDTLEYSVHSIESTPEIPGQFWYSQYFVNEGVVLNQSLEIRVPKDKYVQISSPKLKPETRDEATQHLYAWRHVQLELTPQDAKKKSSAEDDPPKVELTSFRNWEEVGHWWEALAFPQAAATPVIARKAKELTAGLTSDAAKERAIYTYVSQKFRYISISLGAGKYRPHTAAEVLANQYGDCKDKHTLFAALLNAAGIQAWPALIGAGLKFDPSIPSPSQFNHVITVIPQDGKYVWLDTTAEVAPFGLLTQSIRDQQALVIPLAATPVLVKTPIDPPFTMAGRIDVKGALTADGTLTAHFDLELTGDAALGARAGFHQLAPAQWQALAQQISYSLSYAGDVSAVNVDNLEDVDKPFRLSYDYTRKDFPNWKDHQITMALPPAGFGPGDEADKPKESFWAGEPGVFVYSAAIEIPKGFSIDIPSDTTAASAFADYSARYSLKGSTLISERRMTIKKSKVNPEQWAEYQAFNKTVTTDQAKMASLSETNSSQLTGRQPDSDPQAEDLMKRAGAALQANQMAEVGDLLKQVERVNPKQPWLWATHSYIELRAGHMELATADARKELQLHPNEVPAYEQLAAVLVAAGHRDEAIQVARRALSLNPENAEIALKTATLLNEEKRYGDVPAVLERPIASAPNRYDLQSVRAIAFLRGGDLGRGVAESRKISEATTDPLLWNNLAYEIAEAGADIRLARDLAQRAVTQIEKDSAGVTLPTLAAKDLNEVNFLAAAWDTLGWIDFKQKDSVVAEKFLDASWRLSQSANVADHLGSLYDQTGRHSEAIRMWQLAVAADSKNEDARRQLRKVGLPDSGPMLIHEKGSKLPIAAAQKLGESRIIKLILLPRQTASAEAFLLLSAKGMEDIQFIEGSTVLKDAPQAIRNANYNFDFPDSGPERIVRRAILFCSEHTDPSCNLTLLPPSTTSVAPLSSKASEEGAPLPGPKPEPPSLLTRPGTASP